jgi:2-(3-amino-3-carboxypropyl)histidine synthase
MKHFFLEAREDLKIVLPEELLDLLPKKISLFTTIQHIGQVDNLKTQLSKNGIEVDTPSLTHTAYPAQILGCSIKKLYDNSYAYLYVGDGGFHPKALVLKNNKKVFAYNPFTKDIKDYSIEDVTSMVRKRKAGLVKFYSSKEIGVLITTKPGQNRLKRAEKLKELFPDKNFYLLISDTLDFQALEDFNYIECFVNTMCPRIGYDDSIKIFKPVINLEELDEKDW